MSECICRNLTENDVIAVMSPIKNRFGQITGWEAAYFHKGCPVHGIKELAEKSPDPEKSACKEG